MSHIRTLDINPAVPIVGTLAVSACLLRAAPGGDELAKDAAAELLAKSLAGEQVEIYAEITSFNQMDGVANRNFVRFRKGALSALGKSGVGSVFLKNHDQHKLSARGGTITRSKMEKADGGHVLRQTVHAVEPWAVQGFLKGTIDRFSIGWHPTARDGEAAPLVLCTACNADVRECYHWPGDKVETKAGIVVVQFEFQSAALVETSAVNVPAVVGTGVDNVRAALGLSTTPRGKRMEEKTRDGENAANEIEAEKLAAEKAAMEAATLAERKRSASIRDAGKALKLGDEFITRHVNEGTSADDFRKLAIEAAADQIKSPLRDHGRPSIDAGATDAEKFQLGITAALLHRFGPQTVNALHKSGFDVSAGDQYRSFSMVELARACVERAGGSTLGKSRMEIIGMANTLSSGYQATGDWTIAFEEAIHKSMEMRIALSEVTWRRFCSVGRLNDFRPHRLYRLGEMGTWQVVLENGEYKRIEVPDAKRETVTAKKHGNIIAITREAMINDDMSFIMEQINSFVDGGLYTVEALVYAALAENGGLGPIMSDGNPLFDATHGNIGTSAAISVASLDADRSIMRRQRDTNNQRFLMIRPSVLVIATELYGTALVINDAQFDQDEVNVNATNKFQVPNKVRGMFNDIVDAPELTGTRRYMFADPNLAPVLHVGFLGGVERPVVENREGWTVDGTEMKGRYEFGIGVRDWRGALTNAGA